MKIKQEEDKYLRFMFQTPKAGASIKIIPEMWNVDLLWFLISLIYNVNMCCTHSQRKAFTFVMLCKNFLHVKKLIISADESQWVAEVDVPDDRLT